jgi:hypothetical protein
MHEGTSLLLSKVVDLEQLLIEIDEYTKIRDDQLEDSKIFRDQTTQIMKGKIEALEERVEELQVELHWAKKREHNTNVMLDVAQKDRDTYKGNADRWFKFVENLIAHTGLDVSGVVLTELINLVDYDERAEILASIDMLSRTKKIEAIKLLRANNKGLSLKDAKEVVEARMEFLGY